MRILQSPVPEPGTNPAVAPPPALASVLVIDDEEIVGNTLSAMLKAEGFDAVIARSGEEGVELLRARHFEMAIADLLMPGMNGIQTIAALKEADPDVEVIILTGHATLKSSIAALRQGAGDFLLKPLGMEQLRPALMRALDKRRGEAARVEARAHAVIDTAREAIVLFDREGVVRDFNPMAEQIFGWSHEQAVGRNLADIAVPPRLHEVFRKHLETAYREGKDPTKGCLEVLALRQNGEEFPLEISTTVIQTPQGKLLSTFARDITERHQAQKAAQESEAKLQAILDGVETGIFLIDPVTHRIVDANPLALRLVGAPREHVVGALCHKFVCPADQGHCPVTDLGQVVDNSERVLLSATGARRPIIKTVRSIVIAGRPLLLESFVDISTRKLAESALRESEDRYRDLVENSFVLIGTHDAKGRVLNVNRAAARLLEATNAEELVGRPLTNYVPPNLLPQFDEYLQTVLQKGHAEGLMVLATPSGKVKIVEYQNTLRRQDTNEPIVRWMSQDVTERIQAEKAQAFLASLVESSQDTIIGKTPEGIIASWNHGAEELYGYRAEEVVGKSISILAPPDHAGEWVALLEKIRREERISRCETVRVRKDGRLVDVSLTISPIRDGTGKISGIVTTARDITERKRAERALKERTAYLNTLIEISPLGIVVLDTEERIQMSNPAFEKLFRYSHQEMQGAPLNELIVPGGLVPEAESLARQCLSGTSVHATTRRRRQDGTLVDVEVYGVPLVMDGEPRGLMALYQDITDRKRAEVTMAERHRLATLVAEVGVALTGAETLRQGLQSCAEILVRNIDAAFARVWTANDEEKVLELEASAAMYTHIDGGHARVPIGKFKIGRIAESGEPHLTNTVQEDSWVGDPVWARREGMVGFAGYPLKVEERVLGVVAAFARQPLREATLQAFASVADNLAQFIKRKRAEAALRESEKRYCSLFENNLAGVLQTTLDGRILDCNLALAKMAGFDSPQEVLAHRVLDFYYSTEDRDLFRGRLKAQGHLTNLEMRLRHKNGSPLWLIANLSLTSQAAGGSQIIEGTLVDITERKQAEQALAQERDLLRALMDNLPDYIYFKDPQSRILRTNMAHAQALGLSDPAQAAGKTDFDFFPLEDAKNYYEDEKKVFQTGQPLTGRVESVRQADGQLHWCSTTKVPIRDHQGRVTGLVGITRDITERKRAEDELYQSRQMLQSILDTIPQRVFWKDRNLIYLGCNRALALDAGVQNPAEIIGKSDFDLSWKENAESYRADDRLVMEQESPKLNFEEPLSRPDGSTLFIVTNKLPLRDREGRVIGVLGTFEDITERKRAEEELSFKTALLEAESETTIDGILVVDRAGHVLQSNRRFAEIWSIPEGVFKTKDDGKLLECILDQLRDPGAFLGQVDYLYAHESERRRDEIEFKDGRFFDRYSAPLQDAKGKYYGRIWYFRDITERKRAEPQAHLLTTALESAANGIMISNREGLIIWVNPAFTRLSGYSAAEVVGRSPRIWKSGAQDKTFYQHLWKTVLSGQVWQGEIVNRRKDGSDFTEGMTITPVRDPLGAVSHFIAIKEDITGRKRAEVALQESEQRYRLLFTQMIVGFALLEVITDEKGIPVDHRYLEVNTAFEAHAGLRRDMVLGRTIREVLPGIEPFWIETYGKVGTTGESVHFESYAQPAQRWFEVTAFRLRPGRVAVTFADITQRKRAEEEMRASEARYRELFENASDIVYTTDLNAHVTSLNRVAQQTLGYSEEEATQLTLWQVVAPKHWEILRTGRDRLLAGERDLTSVVEVTAKDGRPMVIEVNPRLIYKDGKPVGVQGIGRDITGRDEAEMELRHAQKLESVGRLASGIAHEINTPIQFVGDNTRFLQESFESFQSLLSKYQELRSNVASGAASPALLAELQQVEEASDCAFLLEEVPRAIAQTLEGVDRVATIVRAMKEFAHPEGKEMAAADLNKALLSTLTVARNELKYVADVETDFAELPLVVCNVGDLNQVFLNLLVNAAHAIGEVVKGTFAKGQIRVAPGRKKTPFWSRSATRAAAFRRPTAARFSTPSSPPRKWAAERARAWRFHGRWW